MEAQINPGDSYPIYRLLEDPSDVATHYVRAVVKNAETNEVLETINLTDNGDRTFIGAWSAPYSPIRLYVAIVTTVYDDAGYSVLSANYGQKADYALVEQRWSHAFGGGGGGSSVDYKKIEKMIEAAVEKLSEKIPKIPENRPVDISPVLTKIENAAELIIEKMPRIEPIDLSSVIAKVNDVIAEIKAMPKFEPTDLSKIEKDMPVLAEMIMAEVAKANTGKIAKEKIEVSMEDVQEKLVERIAAAINEKLRTNGVSLRLVSSEGGEDGEQRSNLNRRVSNLLIPKNAR